MKHFLRPALLRSAPLLALLPLGLLGWGARGLDESLEPPLRFHLETGDTLVEVQLDRPFELELEGGAVRCVLRAHPNRRLELAELEFEYPRNMGFEHDGTVPFTIWTLDGNDVVLMLHRYGVGGAAPELLEQFLETMLETYGSAGREVGDVALELDGREIDGRRIEADFAGVTLRQDCYALYTGARSAWLLIVQDSPGDDGESSAELDEVLSALKATFRFRAE